ncbi:unnamed protein product [Camellia sinensis]
MLLLFLVAIPIFLFFFVLHKNRGNGHVLLPPGPPGLPFIGNLHQLNNSAPHRYLWQLSKQYGPLMSLRLGSVPTLVVSSARMGKEVMKTHDLEFDSRPSMVGQQKLSYNGLDLVFAPLNDYWREMRKICVLHLFNSKRVQSFQSVREDEVLLMIKQISKLASANKGTNLSDTLISLTSTIICRVAFGKRYEDEGHARSRFHSLLNEAQALAAIFFVSDYFPLMGWIDKLSGLYGRLEKNFKELDMFYQEIIDDHLDPKRQTSAQEDITDVLLKLQSDRSFAIDLTLDNIKAVLMTSAATLVWAMTALMKNPKVMKRVQDEIRNLIGEKGFVSEDDLQKLPYLKAIVKETLRLYPAAPLLVPRETTQTIKLEGYEIPPNVKEFLPERFLGSAIDFKGQHFELVPFGAGRRGCPGIYMGAVTVELTLANLLYSFDWELPNGMKKEDLDTEVMPGITMHKKNALYLVV